eukprot:3439811-Pleurochrysis_carterae.AAC.1
MIVFSLTLYNYLTCWGAGASVLSYGLKAATYFRIMLALVYPAGQQSQDCTSNMMYSILAVNFLR